MPLHTRPALWRATANLWSRLSATLPCSLKFALTLAALAALSGLFDGRWQTQAKDPQAQAPRSTGRAQRLASAEQVPAGLHADDWNSIRGAYQQQRHAVFAVAGGQQARNPEQQWLTRFDGRGFAVTPDRGDWSWGLELESYGFAAQPRAIRGSAQVRTQAQRVAYRWDDALEEWYVNDQRGLEHGFTLHARPISAGSAGGETGAAGPLEFRLAVRGGLRPQVQAGGQGVRFVDEQGCTVINYAGLKVWDADGKTLAARFEPTLAGQNTLRLAVEESGARYPLTIDPIAQQAYLKASNTGANDQFGFSVAVAGDTVVVGANREDSNATGVNGNQSNNGSSDSGAAYVFVRSAGVWSQQAYLKASNTEAADQFGGSVAVAGDTVVVGATDEDSSTTGVNSTPNETAGNSGAAYVFVRSAGVWSQQAYLKASNTEANDFFGVSVAVAGDTVVVGANREDSNAAGVNGNQSDNSAANSGAAYVFVRSAGVWSQQAYLKASNPGAGVDIFGSGDDFGFSVAITGDTVVVGARLEDSNTTGVNGDQTNNSATNSGAAYVFVRSAGLWSQQAYLKASNTGSDDRFGFSVAVAGDTVVAGAEREDSNATGVNGNQSNNSATDSGAAYVFVRSAGVWSQQAYLKASNTGQFDFFGTSVAVAGDTVVVGAVFEDSNATGVNGDQSNNSATNSGAAYVFVRSAGVWSQQAYLKASNTEARDDFGHSVAVAGDTVVVGAFFEDSGATGINGDQTNNSSIDSGAAYVFTGFGNTPPTISAVGVTRQQGSPSSNSTIANVNDAEDAENTLAITVNGVTVTGATTVTVNGVTISNVSVSVSGVVTADVVAACGATTAMFTLRVTDSDGLFAEATLTVTVNPNTPPVLTYNNPAAIVFGSGTAVNPAMGPSDNGTVNTIAVQSQGTFTGTVLVNALGVVTISNAAPTGTHTITIRATDNCLAATDAPFMLTVNQANTTTAITADNPDPSVVGQTISVNYAVMPVAPSTGTPAGNVTVNASTGESCTGTVAAGFCNLTFNTAGARTLTAAYAGAAGFIPSTSANEPHQVNNADARATTTAITADNPDPSVIGEIVRINFTVTPVQPGAGTPTGTVRVNASTGGSCTGAVSAGSCTIAFFSTAGMRTLTATYAGDANFDPSTSVTEPHQVDKLNTTTTITADTPDPSLVGGSVIIAYTVKPVPPGKGVPTGLVRVIASTGESCIGNVFANECIITFAFAGARTLTAFYEGDVNSNGSTSGGQPHQVDKANTTTAITTDNPDPSFVRETVRIAYTVNPVPPGGGTPTGFVRVTASTGESCGGDVNVFFDGCFITFNTPGARTLTATYQGDDNFNGSTSAAENHVVCQEITITTRSLPVGTRGQPYSRTFQQTGGASQTTFRLVSGLLPPGLTLAANGRLSGVPTNTGVFSFFVRATDSAGCMSKDESYSLTIIEFRGRLDDPIVCLGPGGASMGTIELSNPAPFTQAFTLTTTFTNYAGVPGSCTLTGAAPGATCTVMAGGLTASGALPANAMLTVQYRAQVDDVPGGTTVTATNVATLDGVAAEPNPLVFTDTVTCPSAGPGALPDARSPLSDQKPGSVLLYNVYTSDAANSQRQNTRISLTNTNPVRRANVHLFFVEGASCSVADSYICLTPNQTTTFLAADIDPGTTGFIVAVATDLTGCPLNFNFLIGDAYVKFASGHAANLGAEAFSALTGGLPACDGSSPTAQLNFDGVSYNRAPRTLALSNLGSRADGNDTLLVVNRIGGNLATGAQTLGALFGILYDDAENAFSFTFTAGTCQARGSLSNSFPRTTPRFEQLIPAGRSGWLKLRGEADIALLGAALNFNNGVNGFSDGHNLHMLTLTSAASLTIPVFPPSC